jgi:hypothetical protein
LFDLVAAILEAINVTNQDDELDGTVGVHEAAIDQSGHQGVLG